MNWITYLAGSAMAICLLLMMRRYALRIANTKTAGRLAWAAVFGGVAAVCGIATQVVFTFVSPYSYGYLSIPIITVTWVYWGAMIWGVARFAVGLGRTVHHERPALRLSTMRMYPIAALVVGGIAGQLAGEVLYIQAQRILGSEFGAVLTRTGEEMWQVGVLVGVAALPNRIAMLHRRLTRWREREVIARV